VLPVLFEGQVNAVIELASFSHLAEIHQVFLDQLTESIGIVINTIAAGMRTETLLTQSQSLTQELQSQQEELRETNERLERQAATLRESEERLRQQQEELRPDQRSAGREGQAARDQEPRGRVRQGGAGGEGRAAGAHLQVQVGVPRQHVARAAHAAQLAAHPVAHALRQRRGQPDLKQVEFARTIHGSGTDLLALINDILDLSKIESGTMTVDATDVPFADLRDYVEQNFRHVAQQKSLDFGIELFAGLPRGFVTDPKRLQQILKNLLSNAFKFTEKGRVTLECRVVTEGWSREHEILSPPTWCWRSRCIDTGIGIPQEKQRIIFEAFQQADGTTSRRYGGTGLGLSISRELSRLLGGEIRVTSVTGRGSTFTLYLPRQYVPVPRRRRRPPHRGHRRHARRAACARGEVLYPRRPAQPQLLPRRDHLAAAAAAWRRCRPPSADDREAPAARRPRAAGDRGRRAVRAHHRSTPRRAGLQGRGRARGRHRPGDGAPAQALGDHARSAPARHRRLDRARSAQARRHHSPHPGRDRLGRRPAAARPQDGRVRLPAEADLTRGGRLGARRSRRLRRQPQQAPLVVEDDEAARQSIIALIGSHQDVETTAWAAARTRSRRCASATTAAWCSTSACPT
jgi:signal transduction histidine kinase